MSDVVDPVLHPGRATTAALMTKRTIAGDVSRAVANPTRAWNYLRRWTLLARYAEVPYGSITRYRRELIDDREFQQHLARNIGDANSGFSRAAELYALVRALKPEVIIETGVDSGVSSSYLLRALAANGAGTLHSIDLPDAAGGRLPEGRSPGWLVPDSLRGRWKLSLRDSRELLPDLLARLGHIDLFLHDGDHSYENMSFELEQALPRLSDGGLLVCDDSTLHTAWDDFCAKHQLSPNRIVHMGMVRKRGRESQ